MSEERKNQVETAVLVNTERTEVNESEALNPDVVIVNYDNNDSASGSSLWSFHSSDATGTASETETDVSLDNNDSDTPFEASTDAGPSADMHNTSEELTTEQTEISVLAFGPAFLFRIFALFYWCSGDKNSVTVPRSAGHVAAEIEVFILGMQRYWNNIYGKELPTDTKETFRKRLPVWNTFLQLAQGVRGGTSAIISSNINEDINKFITRLEEQAGAECSEVIKNWIKQWLPRWNMFLRVRAGWTLVTYLHVFFTFMGFILYLVDLASDIAASIIFASTGKWWKFLGTLTIVYGVVVIQTVVKWTETRIHCPGAADRLRYLAGMLVNWPDVKQYWELCRLQWQLHRSPVCNALLVPEWYQRRRNIALLKYMEGMCEACPQAILQLCLLVPDLYGAWTWTDYLRIVGACVSLCTVGSALVNREMFGRINSSPYLPLSEVVVLHMWAVPVTVSRLLSVALFLTLYPYWFLGGVALHLVMRVVFCCNTTGHSSALNTVVVMCLDTLQFLISSFAVTDSIKYRRVYHATHLLVNTAMMVVWALGTPLETAHPALCTAIVCFNAVMFAVGLMGWQLHEKYWPLSYPKPNG